jgi:putative transposase
LRGFDYSQVGEYFETICTRNRAYTLGAIVEGRMKLSQTGMIVENCWRRIPEHFLNVKLGIFQVMPNHVHPVRYLIVHRGIISRGE